MSVEPTDAAQASTSNTKPRSGYLTVVVGAIHLIDRLNDVIRGATFAKRLHEEVVDSAQKLILCRDDLGYSMEPKYAQLEDRISDLRQKDEDKAAADLKRVFDAELKKDVEQLLKKPLGQYLYDQARSTLSLSSEDRHGPVYGLKALLSRNAEKGEVYGAGIRYMLANHRDKINTKAATAGRKRIRDFSQM